MFLLHGVLFVKHINLFVEKCYINKVLFIYLSKFNVTSSAQLLNRLHVYRILVVLFQPAKAIYNTLHLSIHIQIHTLLVEASIQSATLHQKHT